MLTACNLQIAAERRCVERGRFLPLLLHHHHHRRAAAGRGGGRRQRRRRHGDHPFRPERVNRLGVGRRESQAAVARVCLSGSGDCPCLCHHRYYNAIRFYVLHSATTRPRRLATGSLGAAPRPMRSPDRPGDDFWGFRGFYRFGGWNRGRDPQGAEVVPARGCVGRSSLGAPRALMVLSLVCALRLF